MADFVEYANGPADTTWGKLRVEDGHLWFMEENQAVVHWGLPLKRLIEADPMVYQRANVDGARWYSQRMRFSTFLIRVYAHDCPVLGPAGLASLMRSFAQATAKPVLRMPPGYSVVWVWSITDSGEMASRLGGRSCAVKSWLIPP